MLRVRRHDQSQADVPRMLGEEPTTAMRDVWWIWKVRLRDLRGNWEVG